MFLNSEVDCWEGNQIWKLLVQFFTAKRCSATLHRFSRYGSFAQISICYASPRIPTTKLKYGIVELTWNFSCYSWCRIGKNPTIVLFNDCQNFCCNDLFVLSNIDISISISDVVCKRLLMENFDMYSYDDCRSFILPYNASFVMFSTQKFIAEKATRYKRLLVHFYIAKRCSATLHQFSRYRAFHFLFSKHFFIGLNSCFSGCTSQQPKDIS